LVKHTFHHLVKVTLLLCLLPANCQPGCPPPIHLSSLPWLVVVSPLVALHLPPPVAFTTFHLFLLSSCCATSTSHRFKVPPAFKTPPPLVCWCLQLIVTMPLVLPLLLLVLLTIHCLLSANASPSVGLLFACWLSCHPCCRAAATSCPLNTPPPPLVLLTHRLRLKTSRLHLATHCRLLSAGASSLVCLSFAGWFSHIISSRRHLKCPSSTPTFIHNRWLLHLISSRCFRLLSSRQHCRLLMRWQLTSCLAFVRPNWLPVCLTWYAR
jgi:hypothetical protein